MRRRCEDLLPSLHWKGLLFIAHGRADYVQVGSRPRARPRGHWALLKSNLPALLCRAAAGNCAHCYIGKICCLLLVQADYIGPGSAPGVAQRALGLAQAVKRHRPISKLKQKLSSVKLHVGIGKYWVSFYVLVCMVVCIVEHIGMY